ncbi:MAG: glycosyltransferase family 39 protein [Flavobacteriales bacterium]|nr:glycosyltransferase family 39 protein [Flavobacteriales bacterium]
MKNIILFLLVLLSLAFHCYNLEYASYELDEAVHVWHAQKPYAEVVEQASNDPNPPIYNLIISAWVKTFGVSEFSTRFFSVLMGVLAIVAMFFVASRNFGLTVGIVAALFLCFSPIQFRFTHLARPYSLLMLTVILSYGAMFEAMKKPKGWRLFLYYLFSTLMIYVHPTSVFNIPAQGLIALRNFKKDYRVILKFALVMLAAVASFGIWMISIPYFERDDTMWFGPPAWDQIYHVIRVFYGGIGLIILQLGVLLVLGITAIRNRKSGSNTQWLDLLLWLLIPAIASIAFSYLVKPIFQDKYILSVQPAAMLLLAASIYQTGKWLRIPLYITAFSLVIWSIDLKPKAEDDWKSSVEYVMPKLDKNSAVLIDPWYEYRTFAFYFDQHAYELPDSTYKILVAKRVFTAWEDVYDVANNRPKTDVVYVMSGHEGFVTPIVSFSTLDSLATLTGLKRYPGVTIRTYSFSSSLDTLAFKKLDFSSEKGEVKRIGKEDEFPASIVVPLSNANPERLAQINASVEIVSGKDLDGLNFVVTVEKPDQPFLIYLVVNVKKELEKSYNGNTISVSTAVDNFDQYCVVKVYLWNSKRTELEIDNLQVIIKN